MITEEELETFNNDELREKIWNILKDSKNLNFITHFYTTNSKNDKPQKNDINKFYFYLKIPKSGKYKYTISELRANYLNLINEHTLNAIWNLNKIISSTIRNYIDKIERKVKLKMKKWISNLPNDFWEFIFFKNDSTLKDKEDYRYEIWDTNIFEKQKDNFFKSFWLPVRMELWKNGSDKNKLLTIVLSTFSNLLSNFVSTSEKNEATWGSIIDWFFHLQYFLQEYNKKFKSIASSELDFSFYKNSESDSYLNSLLYGNNCNDNQFINNNTDSFLPVLNKLRNQVSHGSFILSTFVSAKYSGIYAKFYKRFTQKMSGIEKFYMILNDYLDKRNLSNGWKEKFFDRYYDSQKYWASSEEFLKMTEIFCNAINIGDCFTFENISGNNDSFFNYVNEIMKLRSEELIEILNSTGGKWDKLDKSIIFGDNWRSVNEKLNFFTSYLYSLFFIMFLFSPFVSQNTFSQIIIELIYNIYLHFHFIKDESVLQIYKKNVIEKLLINEELVMRMLKWCEQRIYKNLKGNEEERTISYKYLEMIKDILFLK